MLHFCCWFLALNFQDNRVTIESWIDLLTFKQLTYRKNTKFGMPLLVLSSMSPLIYAGDKKIFLKVAYFIYTNIFTSVLLKRRPRSIVALFWNLLNLDPVRSHLLVQNLKSFINYVFVLNSLLETCNAHVFYLLSYTMFRGNIVIIKTLLWKVFNGNVYFEVLKTQKVCI